MLKEIFIDNLEYFIMANFKRTERVSELILREISDIIAHDIRDTRIGMVSVSGVDVTRDLKNASVYVTVLGDEKDVDISLKVLNNAAQFIRSRLIERIELRYTPVLKFLYDDSIVNGMRMDKILEGIKNQQ